MVSPSTSSKSPVWSPWTWLYDFVQPINQGWTFGNVTVNEQNSSAPDTEREIVSAESYGRQLGHVIDALAAIIEEQPNWKRNPAFKQLMSMRDKIEKIKTDAAAHRLNRIAADLADLKKNDPTTFEQPHAALAR